MKVWKQVKYNSNLKSAYLWSSIIFSIHYALLILELYLCHFTYGASQWYWVWHWLLINKGMWIEMTAWKFWAETTRDIICFIMFLSAHLFPYHNGNQRVPFSYLSEATPPMRHTEQTQTWSKAPTNLHPEPEPPSQPSHTWVMKQMLVVIKQLSTGCSLFGMIVAISDLYTFIKEYTQPSQVNISQIPVCVMGSK